MRFAPDVLDERERLVVVEAAFLRFRRNPTGAAGADCSGATGGDSGASVGVDAAVGRPCGSRLLFRPRPKASLNSASYQSMTASAACIQGSGRWPFTSGLMARSSCISGLIISNPYISEVRVRAAYASALCSLCRWGAICTQARSGLRLDQPAVDRIAEASLPPLHRTAQLDDQQRKQGQPALPEVKWAPWLQEMVDGEKRREQ